MHHRGFKVILKGLIIWRSLDFMFNVFLDAVEALDLQTARATSSKVLTKTYQLQELAQASIWGHIILHAF